MPLQQCESDKILPSIKQANSISSCDASAPLLLPLLSRSRDSESIERKNGNEYADSSALQKLDIANSAQSVKSFTSAISQAPSKSNVFGEENVQSKVLPPIRFGPGMHTNSEMTVTPSLTKMGDILKCMVDPSTLQEGLMMRGEPCFTVPDLHTIEHFAQSHCLQGSGTELMSISSFTMIGKDQVFSGKQSRTMQTNYSLLDGLGNSLTTKASKIFITGTSIKTKDQEEAFNTNFDLKSFSFRGEMCFGKVEMPETVENDRANNGNVALQLDQAIPENFTSVGSNTKRRQDIEYCEIEEERSSNKTKLDDRKLHMDFASDVEIFDEKKASVAQLTHPCEEIVEGLEKTITVLQTALDKAEALCKYQKNLLHDLLLHNSTSRKNVHQLTLRNAVLEERLLKAAKLSSEISKSQSKIDEQRERQIIALRLQLASALAQRIKTCTKAPKDIPKYESATKIDKNQLDEVSVSTPKSAENKS